mgnify:CR=1 FL=1
MNKRNFFLSLALILTATLCAQTPILGEWISVDDATGENVTYKLYGYNIDLANETLITQDDAAVHILGSTYKTILREQVKDFVISENLFDDETYSYSLTGLEEFYVKNGNFHIMFNPGEIRKNNDYLDIAIEK